ncbi:hypothetical protein GX51_07519 [Blastomyces parvus]|uniref:Uncharacterized protein n=1 Tax=Blastomyces parvus TaxID=2060905 RepID=A0A2B7WKG0_9EURO|nr:hypothetical protein GX51_07519 [Blastomyces parvus]
MRNSMSPSWVREQSDARTDAETFFRPNMRPILLSSEIRPGAYSASQRLNKRTGPGSKMRSSGDVAFILSSVHPVRTC